MSEYLKAMMSQDYIVFTEDVRRRQAKHKERSKHKPIHLGKLREYHHSKDIQARWDARKERRALTALTASTPAATSNRKESRL
jgi:hypothetical protein